LKKYLSFYSEKIIGLSGSPEKVYSVLRLYNIYAAKKPTRREGKLSGRPLCTSYGGGP
jgi:cytochrome oxidase Cu insertion factor (SCO1/SenC/PrrC family)